MVSARIHPGESNASHILKGFINFILSDNAKLLRDKIIFNIIPMLNPDGVILGNYRTGLTGIDFNRQFNI